MNPASRLHVFLFLVIGLSINAREATADVRAWEGSITIPTYPWKEDPNPKFWALEGGARLSTTVHGAITYPYVMQDYLTREKVDRTYKALFLENEYLKVTCLPELGGRLHSVLDKTTGEQMFHLNRVVKPGMIAMRGAWISGGVEWNSGPHGHTVTVLSPVDALTGTNPDGSAYLQISNQEQIFRTRWTVRVTLHPGKAYLDETISLENPTDGMHPYYFWNCTAFPNRPGTRFIYPMTLGTDHNAREFFRWPIHEGRDLTWLRNYETYASIFSVNCTHDFFGAYEVESDRGIVQVADHRELGGKKAWTWGEWEFGKVAQNNLTDEDGPYIEVQSGPLPTQSDYGMLGPHERVTWQEWWYPVHGLGDSFDFANRDIAAQSTRQADRWELRILATGEYPDAICNLRQDGQDLLRQTLQLSPATPSVVVVPQAGPQPIEVTITCHDGNTLAAFRSPLPIPAVEPPDPARFEEKPDEQLSVEQLCLKGRQFDRATDRLQARKYYEMALARDPGCVVALRSLAVLDFEAGLYSAARDRLTRALDRDSDDGLAWYYLGLSQLRSGDLDLASRSGYRATRCFGTVSLGYDLIGRAAMRKGSFSEAVKAFARAVRANGEDSTAREHWMLAQFAAGDREEAWRSAQYTANDPTALVPQALLALHNDESMRRFAQHARAFVGEDEFELLETALTFADLGLFDAASQIVQASCIDPVPTAEQGCLPSYYLAWFATQQSDTEAAQRWLDHAKQTGRENEYASRCIEVEILQHAIEVDPHDARGHLQLGCLLAHLGRVEEATAAWQRAVDLDANQSVGWRNLGLAAAARNDLASAENFYRKAILARSDDQTLYRDLAEILIADQRRSEAIECLEQMPLTNMRRAEITVMLAEAYLAEDRDEDCIQLLESTPYFVNWEGQDVTWRLFHNAHLQRGQRRLDSGDATGALADFEAALTYPENLNVGRSNTPQEACAQYWRGRAFAALGRVEEARAAWQAGAAGADVAGRQNEYRQKCREALAAGF